MLMETCTNPTDVSKAFMEYYQSLFSSSGLSCMDDCLEGLEEKVTGEMNEQLFRDFTTEELCMAISQMPPLKSLGLNGFAPCFYQKYWPLIRTEVGEAVLFCLNSGNSLEVINDTNIVLIPNQ
jgi:hypothetical protein